MDGVVIWHDSFDRIPDIDGKAVLARIRVLWHFFDGHYRFEIHLLEVEPGAKVHVPANRRLIYWGNGIYEVFEHDAIHIVAKIQREGGERYNFLTEQDEPIGRLDWIMRIETVFETWSIGRDNYHVADPNDLRSLRESTEHTHD